MKLLQNIILYLKHTYNPYFKRTRRERGFFPFACIAVTMIAAYVFTFAGCAKQADDQNVETDEWMWERETYVDEENRINVRIGLPYYTADEVVISHLESRLGLNITVIHINSEDDLRAMAEAGTLPDLIQVDIGSGYFREWIENGVIRDITDEELAYFPNLRGAAEHSPELSAYSSLYGHKNWFIPVISDTDALFEADGGRIYYRTDWAQALNISPPETTAEFSEMLKAFNQNYKTSGMALAGGVSYIISLFGTDPESWVWENNLWIPAFYSEKMIPGLEYARQLYLEGAIDPQYPNTKADSAVSKFASEKSGALIRYGDGYWMERVLQAYANMNTTEREVELTDESSEAYTRILEIPMPLDEVCDHIGVLPPPVVSDSQEENTRSYWPRHIEYDALVFANGVSDEVMKALLSLMEYTLTDQARALSRHYPNTRLLSIVCRGLRDEAARLIPGVGASLCLETADIYNNSAIDEGIGFTARFVDTPAKNAFMERISYAAAFNVIVTGNEPVAEMFAAFREECEANGFWEMAAEVTARMSLDSE